MLNLYKKTPPPSGRLNFMYVDESLEYIQLGLSQKSAKSAREIMNTLHLAPIPKNWWKLPTKVPSQWLVLQTERIKC